MHVYFSSIGGEDSQEYLWKAQKDLQLSIAVRNGGKYISGEVVCLVETSGPDAEEISGLLEGWTPFTLNHPVPEPERDNSKKQIPWSFIRQGCFLVQLNKKKSVILSSSGVKACEFAVEEKKDQCWIKVNRDENKVDSSVWDKKIHLHKLLFRMMNVNEGRRHLEDSQLTEGETACMPLFSSQATNLDSEERFDDSAARIIDSIHSAASRSGSPGVFFDCVFRTDDDWKVTVYFDGTSFPALKFGCKHEVFLLVFSSVATKREPVLKRSDAMGSLGSGSIGSIDSGAVSCSVSAHQDNPIFGSLKDRRGRRRSRAGSDCSGYYSQMTNPDESISMEQLMEYFKKERADQDVFMIRNPSASDGKVHTMELEAIRRRILEKPQIKSSISSRAQAEDK
ncbi:hypothetical protein ACWJJH_12370 [Endozoicomonadaceae bacterium StTr2]